MTRYEKREWKKFIAYCLDLYKTCYALDGFRRAINIFYSAVRLNLKQDGFTDDKLLYVYWLFNQEYERVKCRIYGMKNLDATNPEI